MSQIASLFATLGFRANYQELDKFERKLQDASKNLNSAGKRVTQDIQRNTKTQVAGLTSVQRRMSSQRGQMHRLRSDYWRTNQEFRRGNITHERRSQLLTEINGKYRIMKRESTAANRRASATPVGRARAAAETRRAVPVGGVPAVARTGVGAAAGGAAGAVGAMRFAGPAAAVATPAAAVMTAKQSNAQFQQINRLVDALTSTLDDRDKAIEQVDRLYGMAQYLGVQMVPLAEGFRRFQNSFRGTELFSQAELMYIQAQRYFTAAGLDDQQRQSITRGLSQAASAGVIQGDILNILSDAGISRSMIADALGLNLEQLNAKSSSGDLKTSDVLPAILKRLDTEAEKGGALERRLTSTEAQSNRLANERLKLHVQANIAGLDPFFNEIYLALNNLTQDMLPTVVALGEVFGSISNIVESLRGIEGLEIGLPSVADVFGGLAEYLNDSADFIDVLRDDTGWQEKLNGFGDLIWEQFKRITEGFLNILVDIGNRLVPGNPIPRVNLDKFDETMKTPIDGLKVDDLRGKLNNHSEGWVETGRDWVTDISKGMLNEAGTRWNNFRDQDQERRGNAPVQLLDDSNIDKWLKSLREVEVPEVQLLDDSNIDKWLKSFDVKPEAPNVETIVNTPRLDLSFLKDFMKEQYKPPGPVYQQSKPSQSFNIEAPLTINIEAYEGDAGDLANQISGQVNTHIQDMIRGSSNAQQSTEK